jgi:mevalonate kinase
MAHSTGDSDAFQAAQEKQIAFSIRYPTQKITGKMVKDSFKKRREDQQAANRIGARINKKLTNELSPMLQYGDE